MDFAFFFHQRVSFIASFYQTGSQPFTSIISAIEEECPPFDVPPSNFDLESDEPPYMQEWMDAHDGLFVVGQASVSLLSDALKLYFNGLQAAGYITLSDAERSSMRRNGFVRSHLDAVIRTYNLEQGNHSAAIDTLEQIVLARNLSQHGSSLTTIGERHPERDLQRFSSMIFASEAEENLWRTSGGQLSLLSPRLQIDAKSLKLAIEASVQVVKWVDGGITRAPASD